MITKTSQAEIAAYLEDSSNLSDARVEAVHIPADEAEAAALLARCAGDRQPVTFSAGGTNNVGSRLPRGGVLLSVEQLDRIISVDPAGHRATLQAGVVIEAFLEALAGQGLFYPPFPTERTAFISGNAATNASGEYSYHFGATRRYVKRLKLVFSDGETCDLRRGELFADRRGEFRIGSRTVRIPAYRTPDIKCTAGYFSRPGMDAIDLFIGSEGTLALFSEIEVAVVPALPERNIMLLFFPAERDLFRLRDTITDRADLTVYTLEYFDRHSLDFLVPDFPRIPAEAGFALYLETPETLLEQWLPVVEALDPLDSWVTQDRPSYEQMISFRHRLPENINRYFRKLGTRKVSLDFAVPADRFRELFAFYQASRAAHPELETVLFGHLGEHHLHFNYFPKDSRERDKVMTLYREAARLVIGMGGTIAAEHGIGKMKHAYLEMMFGAAGLGEMARVKKTLDPACILGLDNIFPRSLLTG